jgi:urate oxidase
MHTHTHTHTRQAKKLVEPLTDIITTTPAKSLLYECVNTLLCGVLTNKITIRLCLVLLCAGCSLLSPVSHFLSAVCHFLHSYKHTHTHSLTHTHTHTHIHTHTNTHTHTTGQAQVIHRGPRPKPQVSGMDLRTTTVTPLRHHCNTIATPL